MYNRTTDEDIEKFVEEVVMSGAISLGNCTYERAERTVKRMNKYMEYNGYQWRVKLVIDKQNRDCFPYSVEYIEKVFPHRMLPIETIERTLYMKEVK